MGFRACEVSEAQVRGILADWPLRQPVLSVEALGNAGGFSGSRLWRVAAGSSEWCLRRWPSEHPGASQLGWIHHVLRQVAGQDCPFVPVPLTTRESGTWVSRGGHLWELVPWMPGRADYHQHSSRTRLTSALQCLARWHSAARLNTPSVANRSPGLTRRAEQLERLTAAHRQQLMRAIDARWGTAIAQHASDMLRAAASVIPPLQERLRIACQQSFDLQPCIRDIWHDHVLFTGESVSGIVDYGAMAIDTTLGDIARLLGSLVGDEPDAWQHGVQAYVEQNPAGSVDLDLLKAIDRANVVLGGANWIRWLFVEHRQFDDLAAVAERISDIGARLRGWDRSGAH